jgi:NADH:ubiquinone oxidoreductase subunit 6 (subunit J)
VNLTQDLRALVVVAAAPFVLRADDPVASVIWLALCAHAAWTRLRDLEKAGAR